MTTIGILLFSLALGQVSEVVGKVETAFDKKANFSPTPGHLATMRRALKCTR